MYVDMVCMNPAEPGLMWYEKPLKHDLVMKRVCRKASKKVCRKVCRKAPTPWLAI